MKNFKIIASVVAFGFMTIGFAQEGTTIKQVAKNQKERIKEGVKSGSLTVKEAAALKAEQARIVAMKQTAKADGAITKEEKKEIVHARKKASHHIKRKKHN